MDIEFRHLLYFIAVAEEQSFNRGAQRLSISQPTLTRQLSELEARLEVKLFLRNRSGVSLTEVGLRFLSHASAIVAEHNAMLLEMRAYTRSRLRIGYIAPSLFGPVGEAIAQTRQTHPQTTIEIVEAAPGLQLEMLSTGRIDLAFVGHCQAGLDEQFQVHPLYQIPLAVVFPVEHRLAVRPQVGLSELAGETFLGLQEELFPGRQNLIAQLCLEAGFQIGFEQLADSLISLLTLIGHGQGISLVPMDACAIAHPRVVFVPLEGQPAGVYFHAAVRKDTQCPAIDNLLKLCRSYGE